MITAALHPFTELLRMFKGRRRELGNTLKHIDEELVIDAYEDCAKDIGEKILKPAEAKAHAAETYDREALRLIDDVLADGKVTPTEIASLKKARAMTARSAECDHDAGELVKFDTP